MKKKSSGFTLIELMVVIVIIAIFAAIATPIYQNYARKAQESVAQQELMRLATLLDRHKARNFSYQGFAITTSVTPENASATDVQYEITIVDGDETALLLTNDDAPGRNWALRAVSQNQDNFSLLLTSTGIRCKNKSAELVTFTNCGNVGGEPW